MIKGILIINNHGKPRLVKFYQGVVSSRLLPVKLENLIFVVSSTTYLNFIHTTNMFDHSPVSVM